jgi:hypothetical protein
MPATSKAQRQLMAIAEHHPSEVSAKNRGVLKMSHQQLHDFAATKQKGLPKHVKQRGKPLSSLARAK